VAEEKSKLASGEGPFFVQKWGTFLRKSRHRRDWQIEETIWFTKQTYGIEDIRLRRYTRLQNMVALAFAAVYLAAVWLERDEAWHPPSPRAHRRQTLLCHPRFPILRGG